jgi:hypothetical protein
LASHPSARFALEKFAFTVPVDEVILNEEIGVHSENLLARSVR